MKRCRGRQRKNQGRVVEVGFKKYLHGVSDAGCRLLRSGTHELNEKLGRLRGSRMYFGVEYESYM